jgi:hypothetical protein
MTTIRKPTLSKPSTTPSRTFEAAAEFADAQKPPKAASREKPRPSQRTAQSTASAAGKGLSGQIPEGDVRLTANIRQDLHLRLKIAAAIQGTTIGELLEGLIEKHVSQ